MTASFCTNQLSPLRQAVNMQFSLDTNIANLALIYPGIQKNFSLNTQLELGVNGTTSFHDSFFNSTDCTCTNMLLESHYTVYYADYNTSFGVQSQISNVTIDLVYGKYTPPSCSSTVYLSKKNSLTFKQSIYSRKNSGGPGYIKGAKLLTG